MQPVELATGNLLLRAWREEDADAVFRACQDPLVQRWTMVPSPYTREHAHHFVAQYTPATWTAEVGAPLGVFDAGTGDLLGASGLVELDLIARTGEIGTWMAPWARGRAVGERAGRAVARWALDVLRLRRLLWRTEVGNHISKLTGERIGFTFDPPARALLRGRGGELVDGWRGVLLPGEIRETPPSWVAPGGPGARRGAAFATPPARLPVGPASLRTLAERDLDDMLETCRDAEAIRWTSVPVPYMREHALSFLRHRFPDGWRRGTGAGFAIADQDDRFAGTIELRLDPADAESAEIGYLLAPWVRGRGLATAAARAICAWGFDKLALTRIVWRAHVSNVASRRVAEHVGFVMEGVQRRSCRQRGDRHDAWTATLLPHEMLS